MTNPLFGMQRTCCITSSMPFMQFGYASVMKHMSFQMLFMISGHDHFAKYYNLPMPLKYLICGAPHNLQPLFIRWVLAIAGISGFEFGSVKLNLSFNLWTKTGCVIFKVLLCQSMLILFQCTPSFLQYHCNPWFL